MIHRPYGEPDKVFDRATSAKATPISVSHEGGRIPVLFVLQLAFTSRSEYKPR